MDSVPGSFDIVGVAPEATIYMYKALDCTGGGGSDTIMAAMQKAYEDRVDLISMSIGITQENAGWDGGDPLADVTQSITNAGIAVVVAMSNDVGASPNGNDIYTERWPRYVVTSIFGFKANRCLKASFPRSLEWGLSQMPISLSSIPPLIQRGPPFNTHQSILSTSLTAQTCT
jgi:hypothetical protein